VPPRERPLWVYGHLAPSEGTEYEPYLLVFDDNARAEGETGALAGSVVNALGGRVKQRWGRVDATFEAVYETGEWHGDDLSAAAAGGVVGFSFGESWKLRPFAGYDFATGDEDPADGKREEFFNFFPTNHPHYGFADYEGWRNLRSPYGGISWTHGKHFLVTKYHRFLLEEKPAPGRTRRATCWGPIPPERRGRTWGRVGRGLPLRAVRDGIDRGGLFAVRARALRPAHARRRSGQLGLRHADGVAEVVGGGTVAAQVADVHQLGRAGGAPCNARHTHDSARAGLHFPTRWSGHSTVMSKRSAPLLRSAVTPLQRRASVIAHCTSMTACWIRRARARRGMESTETPGGRSLQVVSARRDCRRG